LIIILNANDNYYHIVAPKTHVLLGF